MTSPKEPKIQINGVELTESQAMTVRVALTQYLAEMSQPFALGEDELGETLRGVYKTLASEVVKIMVQQ